jgi:hypothetical protein
VYRIRQEYFGQIITPFGVSTNVPRELNDRVHKNGCIVKKLVLPTITFEEISILIVIESTPNVRDYL